MKQPRHEIGRINSKYYKLVYDRRGSQQACDSKYYNEWRWFLWLGGNSDDYYQGDFKLKRDALTVIRVNGE